MKTLFRQRQKLKSKRRTFEQLEHRSMLSGTPTGGDELLLYRPSPEGPTRNIDGLDGAPIVAINGDGDYVAAWVFGGFSTWVSLNGGLGSEIPNSGTCVGVGITEDGNYAVAHGSGSGTTINRYNSAGAPLSAIQLSESIFSFSMNDSGNFVVAWVNQAGTAIMTQRFDWNGNSFAEGALIANTDSNIWKRDPAVSIAANNDYVVSWTNDVSLDPAGREIDARYFSNGAFVGGTIDVDTRSQAGDLYVLNPLVALNDIGNFAITWKLLEYPSEEYSGIVEQFVAGSSITSVAQTTIVDGITTGLTITQPVVAIDGEGDVVVAWSQSEDGNYYGAFGQAISHTGALLGDQFRIDRPDQYAWDWGGGNPAGGGSGPDPVNVAMNEAGQFIVGFYTSGAIETEPGEFIYGGPDYRLFEMSDDCNVPGDMDGDCDVDANDIDILWSWVRHKATLWGQQGVAGTNLWESFAVTDDELDLNNDSYINEDDVDYMLAHLITAGPNRQYGDADLDGGVGGLDYQAWRQRLFTGLNGIQGWANGDFDGDGSVGGLDYTLWRTRPTQYSGSIGQHAP